MKRLVFAANWKMHLGPEGSRKFLEVFLERYRALPDREVWFLPSAVALESVTTLTRRRPDLRVGSQNVYWEPKGAFTGEMSAAMAKEAGAEAALVGHSERRHVFGESDEDTRRKVYALLEQGLVPMLCVGEILEEREGGETLEVVERQLGALEGHDATTLEKILVAYEPVWAIGTGKTATPRDAAEVHTFIRQWFSKRGASPTATRILYGGSVNPSNARLLVSEGEIDGVLVGSASLDPVVWAEITQVAVD